MRRVALDSIEQPTDAGQTPAPPRRASPLGPCPCPLPPAPVHRSSDPSARLTQILLHHNHKQTRPTSLHCPRRSGRTSLRFGQRPRSRQEFGASRRAMGRPATSSSMSRKVGCHQLAPCFGPATELQRRGAPHHYVLLDTPGGTGKTFMVSASMSRVDCVD